MLLWFPAALGLRYVGIFQPLQSNDGSLWGGDGQGQTVGPDSLSQLICCYDAINEPGYFLSNSALIEAIEQFRLFELFLYIATVAVNMVFRCFRGRIPNK